MTNSLKSLHFQKDLRRHEILHDQRTQFRDITYDKAHKTHTNLNLTL